MRREAHPVRRVDQVERNGAEQVSTPGHDRPHRRIVEIQHSEIIH